MQLSPYSNSNLVIVIYRMAVIVHVTAIAVIDNFVNNVPGDIIIILLPFIFHAKEAEEVPDLLEPNIT